MLIAASNSGLLIEIEHWRRRAEEARTKAETSSDFGPREIMLAIADTYGCLVETGEWYLAQCVR
jgi:hypothetical protein